MSLFDDDLTGDAAVQLASVHRLEASIQARFETFHAANPRVYDLLVEFARQLHGRGFDHCGISLIWERMRWELAITTVDPDGFKLNNDWRSRYARLIMEREKDLAGFFRTRELRAK